MLSTTTVRSCAGTYARKTSTRVIASLGLAVVLVLAFVAGLLVTTAIVVGSDPTSCR